MPTLKRKLLAAQADRHYLYQESVQDTEAEIDFAIATIAEHVDKLRAMSPLWEMVQEGIDLKSIEWSDH